MTSSRPGDAVGASAPAGRFVHHYRGARWWPTLVALLFLASCLPFLATTLWDVDAFNFALGVRDYDVSRHQPHPPGYPLYIALARASTGFIDTLWPETRHALVAGQLNAARGLALWSAVGGALVLLLLPTLFARLIRLGGNDVFGKDIAAITLFTTLLTAACPLYWFTSLRPLSDIPGLGAALAAQVLVLGILLPASGNVTAGRLSAASFVTALIIGIRSQTTWLTLPLLMVAVAAQWRRLSWRSLWVAAVAFALGLLVWAGPMVVDAGGPGGYLAALSGQGAEDFSGVDMLYRNPTPVRLVQGLAHTFIWPWASVPLAWVVLCLAGAGALRLLVTAPRALALGLAAFAPYAVFHLLFHETITTRYALPLVPVVAWMAAVGATTVGRRFTVGLAAALALWGATVAFPAIVRYHVEGSPIARAVRDLADRAAVMPARPAVGLHYDMRRAVEWMLSDRALWPDLLACSPGAEVGCAVRYLDAGGRTPMWFLANPRRIDLALIDPRAVREVAGYRWPFDELVLTANARPSSVSWCEVSEPGWFLLSGWALNPEIAGRSATLGRGPSQAPIEARIKRRSGAAVAVIGGRHLGPASGASATVSVTLDGRALASMHAAPDRRFFLEKINLPAGALLGDGPFGQLTVAASGGGPVAIEQFDLQDADRAVFGFSEGWHESEFSPARAEQWHWASERAALVIHGGGRDVELEIKGESPLRYFERPTKMTLTAGNERVLESQAGDDFVLRAVIPRSALDRSGGIVTLESDQYFTPAGRGESRDARHLALRIYAVSVRAR